MNKNVVEIYTDGSCHPNPGPGSWAYRMVARQEGPFGGHGILAEAAGPLLQTTTNRAEMTAAIEALKAATALGIQEVRVYTDSAYLANCFIERWYVKWIRNGWINGTKKPIDNRDLWDQLLALHELDTKITWEHVRGHSGITHNEACDRACLTQRMIATRMLKESRNRCRLTRPVPTYT